MYYLLWLSFIKYIFQSYPWIYFCCIILIICIVFNYLRIIIIFYALNINTLIIIFIFSLCSCPRQCPSDWAQAGSSWTERVTIVSDRELQPSRLHLLGRGRATTQNLRRSQGARWSRRLAHSQYCVGGRAASWEGYDVYVPRYQPRDRKDKSGYVHSIRSQ